MRQQLLPRQIPVKRRAGVERVPLLQAKLGARDFGPARALAELQPRRTQTRTCQKRGDE